LCLLSILQLLYLFLILFLVETLAGNKQFRDIVAVAIPGYVSASSRSTKTEIVTDIVRQVREKGGRFLKRDTKRNVWYVLNYTQSKEKAGHAIRDATITEDSKKERAEKRKKQRAVAMKSHPGHEQDHQRRSSSMSQSSYNSSSNYNAQMDDDSVTCSDSSSSSECELSSPETDFDKALGPLHKEINFDSIKPCEQPAAYGGLTDMLMAHFPTKLLQEEAPTGSQFNNATSFEPLPIDDPFNSYIDQLLGPLTDF